MKYPSVFISVAVVWVVVDVLAAVFHEQNLIFQLYLSSLFFSVALFLIGFWRNK
jgi:hypothetical protein